MVSIKSMSIPHEAFIPLTALSILALIFEEIHMSLFFSCARAGLITKYKNKVLTSIPGHWS
jgi:hypothetical protein